MSQSESQNSDQKAKVTVAEQLEKNKRDALRLAGEIFRVVKDPEFLRLKPEVRMNVVKEKCPEFCKHYPMVVSWMTYHLKYSHAAFSKYLDKLANEHGKQEVKQGEGYKNWARKQADYAKILYMETTPHWSSKIAGKIWNSEYQRIIKTYDDMKKEEEKYKSEFEEEKEQHHEELIDEILNLVSNVKSNTVDPDQLSHTVDQGKPSHTVDQDQLYEKDDLIKRAENIQKWIDRKVHMTEEDDDSFSEETPEEQEIRRIKKQKEMIRRQAELELLQDKQKEEELMAAQRAIEVKASFLPSNLTSHTKLRKKKTRKARKK